MSGNHPKSVRRRLLKILYDHYQADPLEMLSPTDIIDEGVARDDLVANIYYLHDRELIELMMGYNPPLFAAARITADGIDLVENRFEFDLRFPPAPDEAEDALAGIPLLLERLIDEAEFSPLDGEKRHALLRDVQFLRDEIARPATRWRTAVIDAVLGWVEGHFDHADEAAHSALPSLAKLREALKEHVD